TAAVQQTFLNGVDTISMVLYYAPYQKYAHQMTVILDDLSASTQPFILKPGSLDTIAITPETVPILNTYDPGIFIKAKGYDQFGNYLPNELYQWHNDSTLTDYTINAIYDQIYFEPSKATKAQEGYLTVTSVNDTTKKNHVYISIKGPVPMLMYSMTRDFNGNGLLDVVELNFNKPVHFPPTYDPLSITIRNLNPNRMLYVDSVSEAPFGDGVKWYLYLNEQKSIIESKEPQTAWTPVLTIDDFDSIAPVKYDTCRDGAAPVIWSIVKKVIDPFDKKKDEVTITLSEYFYNYNGSAFLNAAPQPAAVLNVWTVVNGDTIRIDSIFAGINQFSDQRQDWMSFTMSNGQDLNNYHLVNLDHINGYVADEHGMIPHSKNQKVRVQVEGAPGKMVVGPVPVIPTLQYHTMFKDKPLEVIHPQKAGDMIKTYGGTTINFEVQLAIDQNGMIIRDEQHKVQAHLSIFDVAGNLVYTRFNKNNILNEDIYREQFNTDSPNGVKQTLTFFWGGDTDTGMKVAPGVYRILLYLQYNNKKTRLDKTIAVGR
ncbi:MAG: hypothetical protein JW795_10255, partial [Chitinivibrionales bacterium]|nr:hypothetical protein [Chitinivibrionales bacterium]